MQLWTAFRLGPSDARRLLTKEHKRGHSEGLWTPFLCRMLSITYGIHRVHFSLWGHCWTGRIRCGIDVSADWPTQSAARLRAPQGRYRRREVLLPTRMPRAEVSTVPRSVPSGVPAAWW